VVAGALDPHRDVAINTAGCEAAGFSHAKEIGGEDITKRIAHLPGELEQEDLWVVPGADHWEIVCKKAKTLKLINPMLAVQED
jgi:hypothetical protein